jgi:hypothetical protein
MSIQLAYTSKILATETLESNVDLSSDKTVSFNGLDTVRTLNETSTPPVAKGSYQDIPLVAGAKTLDLAALVGANSAAVNGTGLRVQTIKIRNKATNANAMTIAKGASNGYDGLGANFSITLVPGAEMLVLLNDGGTDIGATNKTLDVAGTLTQVVEVGIVMG